MAETRKMTKTRHPGVFKRGARYVVVYRVNGRQRKEYVRTLDEALRLKRARETDRDRGEFQALSRVAFRDYAEEWIERYQGNGRGGFRESTREDYRRDLRRYVYPFLADRLGRTVSGITPRDIANWIAWLCDEQVQGELTEQARRAGEAKRRDVPLEAIPAKPAKPMRLADATVRRIVSPARACLASARREGMIRHNPVDGAVLPTRPEVEEDEAEHARVMTREQLRAFLSIVHPRHRAMFRLLAATGLRWSELAALRRRDLALDGSEPRVSVRRALVRGRFGAPKSRYGRREVPLTPELVAELRRHLAELADDGPDALAFPSQRGTPLAYPNMMRRVLKPIAEEAGAPWAGFHTFRHTFASLHIARGTTLVQLSRLLGHHSPEFTLRVYAHLIPGDESAPLDLAAELPARGNDGATDGTRERRTEPESAIAQTAS